MFSIQFDQPIACGMSTVHVHGADTQSREICFGTSVIVTEFSGRNVNKLIVIKWEQVSDGKIKAFKIVSAHIVSRTIP